MSRELEIGSNSVRSIVKHDLGLKPIKFQAVLVLTDTMLWTDEAYFSIEQAFNKQNDRILTKNVSTANLLSRFVQKSLHPKSLMAWAEITSDSKIPLVFVEHGVKINQQHYQDEILAKALKPWAQKHFSTRNWVLQQDSAPAHRARTTPDYLKSHNDEWPSNSPDINQMDFDIWGILKVKVLATSHQSLDDLKGKLIKKWNNISDEVLRAAVDDVPKRLMACKKEKGGYFEK